MKVVFMGTPSFGVPILEALTQKYEVVLVVTQPDKPVGRKKILTPAGVFAQATICLCNRKGKRNNRIAQDWPGFAGPPLTALFGGILNFRALSRQCSLSLLPKYRAVRPFNMR